MTNGALIVICIILLVLLLIALATYNALMHLRHEVRAAWAVMDEQLKLRYHLIPQLLQVVQNTGGEAATKLPAVSAAKNQAAVAFNPALLASAEAALSTAIKDLLNAADRQDNLKSDPTYIDVRQKLLNSDRQISTASRFYNDHVHTLNASMCSFPYQMTAKVIGLRMLPTFEG